MAARVKELEHVTNGYVDIITDQRIALKTYPEQLELIRALIMKEQKHAKSIEALPSSSASAPIDVEKQLEKHGQLLMRMLQEHEASSEAHISTMEPMFVSLELLQEVLSPTLRSTKSKWVLHNSSPKEIMGNQLRETACSLFDSFVSIESHHKGLAAVRAEVEALGAERITELEKTVDRCRQRVKTLEETVHNLSRTLQQQMGKTPEWKNELETLSYTVNLMSAQQLNAVKQLMEDLSRLQGELDKKAEDHEIHQIITSLEAEFKRKLGDDVIGLRDVIEKMLGAMRLKPSKDEVTSLLAERLDALQKLFPEQVEGFTAVSVKCLSCGQQRVEPLPDNVLPIEMSYSSSNSTSRFEREEYDQIRAVLTRTAGLKPLAPEHKPMVPRAMPFASRSNLNPAQSIKQSQQPGSGGLLFQRARLARNMIDRVKLPSAATDSITPRLLFEGISDTSSYGGGDIADNYESGGISNRGHQLRNTLRVRTAAGSGRRRASGNNRAIQASSSSFAPYDTGDHLSTASSAYRENDSFASSQ